MVEETLGQSLVETRVGHIAQACETLDTKGGLHEMERKGVKTGTGN